MEQSFVVDLEPGFEFGSDVSEQTIAAEESLEFEDFEAIGIDPIQATAAKPGSVEKVQMLSARYDLGLPLWHNEDCDEHGPREPDLKGNVLLEEQPPVLDLSEFETHDDELDEEEVL